MPSLTIGQNDNIIKYDVRINSTPHMLHNSITIARIVREYKLYARTYSLPEVDISSINKVDISSINKDIHFVSEKKYSIDKDNLPNFFFSFSLTPYFSSSYSAINTLRQENQTNFFVNDLYPISVRSIVGKNFYVERPPFQATVDFCRGSIRIPFKIWIPWTLLVTQSNYGDSRLYFSDQPLTVESDTYLRPFTPNIWPDSKLCFSYSLNKYDLSDKSIKTIYSNKINEYFSGGWNYDLSNLFQDLASQYFSKNPISRQDFQIKYPILYNLFYISLSFLTDIVSNLKYKNFIRYTNNIISQLQASAITQAKSLQDDSLFIQMNSINQRDISFIYTLYYLSKLNLPEVLQLQSEMKAFISDFNLNSTSLDPHSSYMSTFSDIVQYSNSVDSSNIYSFDFSEYSSVNMSHYDSTENNLDKTVHFYLEVDPKILSKENASRFQFNQDSYDFHHANFPSYNLNASHSSNSYTSYVLLAFFSKYIVNFAISQIFYYHYDKLFNQDSSFSNPSLPLFKLYLDDQNNLQLIFVDYKDSGQPLFYHYATHMSSLNLLDSEV